MAGWRPNSRRQGAAQRKVDRLQTVQKLKTFRLLAFYRNKWKLLHCQIRVKMDKVNRCKHQGYLETAFSETC